LVVTLAGVGPTRARRLETLGIRTVGDLRTHFPHRYIPYPPPQPAASIGFQHLASFEGLVRRLDVAPLPGKRVRITAILGDSTGTIAAVWIRGGGVPSGIEQGARLAVSGPLVSHGRQAYFDNPDYEPARLPPTNTRRIVPVYPLTAGLTQPFLRGLVRRAIEGLPPLEEILPPALVAEAGLLDRDEAIQELHEPTSLERAGEARRRFAFEEILPLQLLVLQRRLSYRAQPSLPIVVPWSLLAEVRQRLPFNLTAAQQRVLSTILDDLSRPQAMIRLLQGEVGSGKTVVAALALLAAVTSGGQAALVAPTEILAEQHLRTLTALYDRARPAIEAVLGRPLVFTLLRGSLSRSERERARALVAAGEADVVIGTHAVIESDVEFACLALAVVDEQHRFGVSQRVALRRKGENPHLLVMTATPIPRTLALSLYGDLDLSIIDELPIGRQPVETVLLRPAARAQAYERIRSAAAKGQQAFVICPLVEGSPAMEARAATTEFEELRRGALAGLRLALLHGRMRSADKDRVMREFAAGEHDVLVSTTVVEVGVDVPNATVMVVEGAERFGLAQLHQLRGRVGRGSDQAICFLLAGTEAPESLERLGAVARSHNGLELAEEDLRIRGPGDYYGLRQSGFPPLRIARLEDLEFVQHARAAAQRILDADPTLERPEHVHLAEAVRSLGEYGGEAN
jgi:ATP-dependent DNA helicase RecG